MTEQERHLKIAQALKSTAAKVDALMHTSRELVETAEALLKRGSQLLRLSEEFAAGKYLSEGRDGMLAGGNGEEAAEAAVSVEKPVVEAAAPP